MFGKTLKVGCEIDSNKLINKYTYFVWITNQKLYHLVVLCLSSVSLLQCLLLGLLLHLSSKDDTNFWHCLDSRVACSGSHKQAPTNSRNPKTNWMKSIGHGVGYWLWQFSRQHTSLPCWSQRTGDKENVIQVVYIQEKDGAAGATQHGEQWMHSCPHRPGTSCFNAFICCSGIFFLDINSLHNIVLWILHVQKAFMAWLVCT